MTVCWSDGASGLCVISHPIGCSRLLHRMLMTGILRAAKSSKHDHMNVFLSAWLMFAYGKFFRSRKKSHSQHKLNEAEGNRLHL